MYPLLLKTHHLLLNINIQCVQNLFGLMFHYAQLLVKMPQQCLSLKVTNQIIKQLIIKGINVW